MGLGTDNDNDRKVNTGYSFYYAAYTFHPLISYNSYIINPVRNPVVLLITLYSWEIFLNSLTI
jgi:hypothetical protein